MARDRDRPDRDRPERDRPGRDRPGRDRPGRIPARAAADIAAAFQPQLDELTQQGTAAEADAAAYQEQVARLYAALQAQLAGLGPAYQAQVGDIRGQLQQSLAGLTGMLGGYTPAAEQGAAAGLFGTLGAGGLSTLAGQQARGVGFNTSVAQQAAVDATNYQTNVLSELDQFRRALAEQRTDLLAQQQPLILSRIDELRDRAAQLRLARQEFELRQQATQAQLGMDQAQLDFTQQQAQDALNTRPGRDRPGGDQPPTANNNTPSETTPPAAPQTPGPVGQFVAGDLTWRELTNPQQQRLRGRFRPRRLQRLRQRARIQDRRT